MDKQLVSIVIPAYNAEAFLARAIESVLSQSYTNREIIVVNDGSTDGTKDVASKYPVRYHYQENGGESVARNTGIGLAKGDWIGFLDADDELLPNMIEDLLAVQYRYPEAKVVSAAIWKELPDGKRIRQPEQGVVFPREETMGEVDFYGVAVEHPIVCIGKVLLANEVIEKVGGFNPKIRLGPDTDLWGRVAGVYRWYFHDVAVGVYHFVPSSVFNSMPASRWFIDGTFPFKDEKAYLEKIDECRRDSFQSYRKHQLLYLATLAAIDGNFSVTRMLLKETGYCTNIPAWWPLFIISYTPFISWMYRPFRRLVQEFLSSRIAALTRRYKRLFS